MQTSPLRLILAPEKGFYALVVIYGVVIGILTLSIPTSPPANPKHRNRRPRR